MTDSPLEAAIVCFLVDAGGFRAEEVSHPPAEESDGAVVRTVRPLTGDVYVALFTVQHKSDVSTRIEYDR